MDALDDAVVWKRSEPGLRRPVDYRAVTVGLVFLALAVRLVVVSQVDVLRFDGAFYIENARRFEEGQVGSAFHYLGFNLYPVVLAAIHKLGLGYETGGQLWSILISSLAVVPLVGLARRDFGFPIACGAALLYSVHPRIVEWSVEIVREPTFWFCTLSMLFTLRRALDGDRPIWYLAAAASFLAAVLVRSEGFVLIIPAVIWWGAARLRCQGWSRRAVIGFAVAVIVPVAGFWTVNELSLKHSPRFARLDLLRSAVAKMSAHVRNSKGPATIDETSNAGPRHGIATIYGRKLFKACDPAVGTFAIIGLFRLRRRLFRVSQFGLTCMNAALMAAVFIYLDAYREINTRYFLTGVLLLLPYSAAGLIVTFNFLSRLFCRLIKETNVKPILLRVGCAGMAMGLMFDAMTVDRQALRAEAVVGRWIESRHGKSAALGGWRVNALFPYYAHSDHFIALPQVETQFFATALREANPEIVVAAVARGEDRAFEQFLSANTDVRYEAALDAVGLPPTDLYRIYVRADALNLAVPTHTVAAH